MEDRMVALERVEWADPDLQRLVAAQKAEIDARYEETDEVPEVDPTTVKGAVVARGDERVVACGILTHAVRSFAENTAEVGRMFVDAACGRRGSGKELLSELGQMGVDGRCGEL